MLIDRRALSLVPAAALVASLAVAPAAAKETGLIFVSNEKSNNLIVIDPKTFKVIKDIKTSRRPRDMHFSADRSKLYVACGDDDVIDILDVAKLEVIGRIPTGPSPETFAIDEAKRRIYVANEEGSSLSIIDMDQAITIHEVPTGAEPEGVYVAEDGKTLYVTSEVGDLIHLVASHHGYFTDEAAMAEASVTRIVSGGEARALPPVWLAHAEVDDNVPTEITEAFVSAFGKAGGRIERVYFPGARHGFMQQASADTDKSVALMRDFIGRM